MRPTGAGLVVLFLVAGPLFVFERQAGSAGERPRGEVVPSSTIVVDGDPQDWFNADIAPLIVDPADYGPPGLDMLSLRVTDDEVNVYFLYEFVGPPVGSSGLMLDVDIDASTGCQMLGLGFEYGIIFGPTAHPLPATSLAAPSHDLFGSSHIGDARDCGWSDKDFPGALTTAVGGNFIEASVSIATLKILNPQMTQFDITGGIDRCDVARYVVTPCTLGVQPSYTGDLVLNFTLGTTEAATWNTWLIVQRAAVPLWSLPLPVIDPPIPRMSGGSLTVPSPSFPNLGVIGVLTVLRTQSGITCFDLGIVDTGP